MVAAMKLETTLHLSTSEPSLTAPQHELKKVLGILNRFADRKSTMPMLSALHARIGVDDTTLTATDLNTWIRISVPAWGRGNGSFVARGKPLGDIVAKLPKAADVTLAREHNSVMVLSGTASLTAEGFHAQDFPRFPEPTNEAMAWWSTVDAKALVDLLKRTDYSTCRDETRFHLNGTFIETDGKTVRAVSTDGHRLTRATAPIKGWTLKGGGVLVPRKATLELAKLLKAGECDVLVCESSTTKARMLYVKQNGWMLVTKLIDAQFPPYDAVIPKAQRKLVTVERLAFIAAMERAAVMGSETRGVKLHCEDGQLKITAENGEGQESREWMPAEHQGGTAIVGFNPKYLIETCSHFDGERITIGLGGELDPGLFRDTDDVVTNALDESPYVCVVMPMHI